MEISMYKLYQWLVEKASMRSKYVELGHHSSSPPSWMQGALQAGNRGVKTAG
jgi:monoamine oxidase